MPRPDPKAPGMGQDTLDLGIERTGDERTGQVLRGRHSKAMDRALTAARNAELLAEVDEGLATTARACAWALDTFEKRGQAYGPAKLVPAITEALRELHMTPESRQADMDTEIADLLRDLGTVATDDAEGTGSDGGAALHHAPE